MAACDDNQKNALIFGTISVAVISFLSLAGVAVVPLLRLRSGNRWLQFFVALAVATLAGDALLHIIPAVLGVHGHESEGCSSEVDNHSVASEDHLHENHSTTSASTITTPDESHEHHDSHEDHEDHEEHEDHLWEARLGLLRMMVVFLTLYLLYIFETLASTIFGGHSHSKDEGRGKRRPPPPQHRGKPGRKPSTNLVRPSEQSKSENSGLDREATSHEGDKSSLSLKKQPTLCFGLKPIALMILAGDGVHNFADGMAIGVTFMAGIPSGLATSIAVAFHELPHEIGDFAILLDSGLSICRAMMLNFISALTAFLGLYVGIAVGGNASSSPWLLAIAAGMFLYIALVDMMPYLKELVSKSTDRWYISLLIQNAGILIGFFLVFVLGWFEDQIRDGLSGEDHEDH